MSTFWTERSLHPERMDLEPLDEASTASILGALERINLWLGGVQATLSHVRQFARRWQPGEHIRFIDWGTGGADIPRAIVRWGRKNGYRFEIVGVDNNPVVVEYARKACREYPEIKLISQDIAQDTNDLRADSFDYALSSLCLHHLTDPQIISILQKSNQLASRGIIMNDLKRSARAWLWIWAMTRLGHAHPIVKNDGPLSVRRAFRKEELEDFAIRAGVSYLKVKTHFGYRLTLAGEKPVSAYRRVGVSAKTGVVSPTRRLADPPAPDVVVIGGGPAGSSAAIRLARAGLRVRLYEKSHFPRSKLCGGFLSPESLIDLEQLGVLTCLKDVGATPIRRVSISTPSGARAESSLPAPGLSLGRDQLDAILLDKAGEAGVDIRQGTKWNGEEIARWTIVAAGRGVGVPASRRTGEKAVSPKHRHAETPIREYYGVQACFEKVQGMSDQVEINLVGTGYVGLVRQADCGTNVCALTTAKIFKDAGPRLDDVLEAWKRQNRLLAERLNGARRTTPWKSTGPVRLGMRQVSQPRTLFTGDAACVVDPFVGEGIAMALRSAALLQNAFSQNRETVEAAYTRQWHEAFDSGLRFQQLTRQILSRRRLSEVAVRGMTTYPGALRWITQRTRPRLYAHT